MTTLFSHSLLDCVCGFSGAINVPLPDELCMHIESWVFDVVVRRSNLRILLKTLRSPPHQRHYQTNTHTAHKIVNTTHFILFSVSLFNVWVLLRENGSIFLLVELGEKVVQVIMPLCFISHVQIKHIHIWVLMVWFFHSFVVPVTLKIKTYIYSPHVMHRRVSTRYYSIKVKVLLLHFICTWYSFDIKSAVSVAPPFFFAVCANSTFIVSS